MALKRFCLWLLFLFVYNYRIHKKYLPAGFTFLVVPEDVPTGLVGIYGFAPRLVKGNDHRFGFGFRFGNAADFQILYEFGPQTVTKPLQSSRSRSTPYHQRMVKKRPFIELLLNLGILREASYEYVHERGNGDEISLHREQSPIEYP